MNTSAKKKEVTSFFYLLEKITTELSAELMSPDLYKDQPEFKIKEVKLHPGWEGSEKRYKKLKEYLNYNSNITLCSGIYTLISNITKVQAIESEQADVTLQLSSYILLVSNSKIALEKRMDLNLLTPILNVISNNRWKLNAVFPAVNLKSVDLYGLTVEAKQITGIKGWNPSIQAHAKDLYEDENEAHPKDLSLFLFNWEQTIRIKENIFNLSKKDRNSMVENLIITQK